MQRLPPAHIERECLRRNEIPRHLEACSEVDRPLRHTAAAAWLPAGNSLMYVPRQLGHADMSTTERYYRAA